MDTWEVTFDKNRDAEPETSQTNGNGTNVGKIERIASAVGGGALLGYAIKSRSRAGMLLGLVGAGLLYRGATGQCELYRAAGINTSGSSDSDAEVARDVHVEKSITINSAPRELYNFWRNLENLPRFMENLESVTELDENRSHWVAIGPGSKKIEWDAEIYNEKEGEMIAWRSLPGADITNAGSVHFEAAPGGQGTDVKVTLNYNPPGGKVAALFAKFFGQEPGQLVEHNLKRLKQLIETGAITSTDDLSRERKANKMATKTPAANLSRAAEGAA